MKRTIAAFALAAMLTAPTITAVADEPAPDYTPGVTVAADDESSTGYTATFVYESDDPGLSRVMLYSDTFMLYDEQAPRYTGASGMNLNDLAAPDKAAYQHLPGDYKDTYWPGGGSGSSRFTAELTKVANTNYWVTQVQLSSGAFVYNYEITQNGVTTARLDDPANPALVNTATGIRSLSSMVYVPYNAQKQGTGPYRDRSIELPRTDGHTGTVQTITYPSADGTDRGMSVYLPYGYDANRAEPYKVLYINMGNSGDQLGNELRWMNEGALGNIVDNLVAEGREPFVVVSANYQDWGHDFTRIEPDVLNNILPFVQARYNVAETREGRGYAGLSAGAGTTARFYLNHPEVFSQFGIWSNGVTPTPGQIANVAKYKDSTRVHIAVGTWDYVAAPGRTMSDVLTANGIPHAFTEIPGGHDWEFWQLMLAEFATDHLWQPVVNITATTTPRMLGTKVYLSASATNNDTIPVDLVISTAYGSKTIVGVAPGATVGVSINTRRTSIPAGQTTVRATGTRDGAGVAWSTTVSYGASPAAP